MIKSNSKGADWRNKDEKPLRYKNASNQALWAKSKIYSRDESKKWN